MYFDKSKWSKTMDLIKKNITKMIFQTSFIKGYLQRWDRPE